MRLQDVEAVKMVKRAIIRRSVDCSNLDIRVSHGVVYVRGKIDGMRGSATVADLPHELAIIQRIIQQQPGVREVIFEIQGPGL